MVNISSIDGSSGAGKSKLTAARHRIPEIVK
jgi:hypothetical protein